MGFESNFHAPDGTLLPDNVSSLAMLKPAIRDMDCYPDQLEKLYQANTF